MLNEYGADLTLSISDDNVKLDNYIEQALSDAVAMLATEGRTINPKSISISAESGMYSLPDDFVSVISVELPEWNVAATRIVGKNTPEYRRAKNIYTPPGVNTPICYREGAATFVCVPSGGDAKMLYNATLVDTFSGDDKTADAVAYMAASLVLAYFEDDNGKNRLAELAMLYLK